MNFWHFSYTGRYYLTHPWKWLFDLIKSLKYAWQRAFRGWDDTVIWSIDGYLAEVMPIWLRVLKQNKHGTPIVDGLDIEYNMDDPDNEKYWAAANDRWDTMLQLMIEGFESAKLLIDGDLPIFEEAHQVVDKHPTGDFWSDFELFDKTVNKLGGRDRMNAEREALYDSYKHGMEVFVEYFFALWD